MRGIGTSTDPTLVIGTKMDVSRPPFVIPAKAGIQRGRVAPTTPKHFERPGLIFIPWCAGTAAGMSDWYENGCFAPRPRESREGAAGG